ncbi:2-oxo-4-hydroxy-4-carboxy-5-ureidoimidazoline decarboxylase [Alteromonas sp. C1M14]|uniref:2-oxo-4-hydroxy-4-carboxy-5-ureidoimidazoline decarboxylase n=1 Tax=Alteromonas sp. C1M14 TaxID=2841567 RepID=UPI001C08CABD|nr:2-oxo-4-hydroxy-4-carboxy-5-ureidoimidazoline decarboxylase [Alteromonas sp. C1M14]MBU2978925.1 2-oxo-4-hydroxy-4-carboxy-5-ureidoimidazoline decarboxylase [Alteromonas sp. C1M14]
MKLSTLNELAKDEANAWFTQTCAAQTWTSSMTALRPFESSAAVISAAKKVWLSMEKADFLAAFAAHPMIGDIDTLRSKFANTRTIAANEQSGTASADEATLLALKAANQAYLDKHGFIFIICATGLSAEAMLSALQGRIDNTTAQEIANAAAEQIKITCLRIEKALED